VKNITRCATSENEQEHNTQQTHQAFPKCGAAPKRKASILLNLVWGWKNWGEKKEDHKPNVTFWAAISFFDTRPVDRLRHLISPSARASSV